MDKKLEELETVQDVFYFVKNHLLTQNEQSVLFETYDKGKICAYKDQNGLKCAVGCLISDDYYTDTLEEHNSSDAIIKDALFNSLKNYKEEESILNYMMEALQYMHDTIHPKNWEKELKLIAKRYNLNYE